MKQPANAMPSSPVSANPGRPAAAVRTLPDRAEAAIKAGRPAQAMAICRKLMKAGPDLGEGWARVAAASRKALDYHTAEQAARLYLQARPDDPNARLRLAEILSDAQKSGEALQLAEGYASRFRKDPRIAFFAGSCAGRAGDPDKAKTYFRRALKLRPAYGVAWHHLAWLQRFEGGGKDVDALRKAVGSGAAQSPREQAALHFALGKAYDDLDETGAGFEEVSAGARLMAGEAPWNADAFDAYIDDIRRSYDDVTLARHAGQGAASPRPVFVLGMLRSGTTLVDRMLGQHPAVSGGGELPMFTAATHGLGEARGEVLRQFLASSQRGHPLEALGRSYLRLLAERFPGDGRVIDKALNNSLKAGLILMALPQARIIWMTRDPGAVAWSCLRVQFAGGHEWSCGQTRLARRIRGIERLQAHFAPLSERILVTPYESLVSDPESWMPKLARHCGLEYDPAMAEFHRSGGGAATASMAQVREPVHTRSVASWRRYEDKLAPFLDAYQAAGGVRL